MSDAVEQIKQKLTIVDVITPYVELHKAGKNYKGKSPFTSEKTPSFYVSPDRGLYYCFSSSQGGDMFNFIQNIEGVDFKGALKILADKAGVELVKEDPQKRTERDQVYAALAEAAAFYRAQLGKTPPAVDYLTRRGVTESTRQKWQLGYAPGPPHGGWRDVRQHLSAKQFQDPTLFKAGLIKQTDQGKEPYDVFRDRIMFPMCDPSGRVVAFSGRLLSKDSDAPKYVNSPETELYKKSELLFGYDKAKEGIRRLDFSLIVEGQFDVVLCHQAGYANTVAVSGTALTMHHVQLLERLSSRVVLALDADRAGIAAVERAAELMLARGLDVKVAELPEGKDPADLIAAGTDEFKKIIGHAKHVIEFMLAVLKRSIRDDRDYKLKVRERVVPYLVLIENRIDREHFERVVADALSTTKDAIHYEVQRLEEKSKHADSAGTALAEDTRIETVVQSARYDGLREYAVMLVDVLPAPEAAFLKRELETVLAQSYDELRAHIAPAQQSQHIFTLEESMTTQSARERRERVIDLINELREVAVRRRIGEARRRLQEAEAKANEAAISEALTELTALQQVMARPRLCSDDLPE